MARNARSLDTSLNLRFQVSTIGVARSARNKVGQFTSMQTLVRQANEAMALEVAQLMVEALKDSVKGTGRRQRGTELLEAALIHEENREASIDGFVVGTGYLERSPAKYYWRGVEEGSAKHVGRLIYGWFADEVPSSADGRFRPVEGGKNGRMIQLPHPVGTQGRGAVGATPGPGQEREGGPFWFRIKNPIPAYHYMQRGAEAWLERNEAGKTYQRVLAQAGIELEL